MAETGSSEEKSYTEMMENEGRLSNIPVHDDDTYTSASFYTALDDNTDEKDFVEQQIQEPSKEPDTVSLEDFQKEAIVKVSDEQLEDPAEVAQKEAIEAGDEQLVEGSSPKDPILENLTEDDLDFLSTSGVSARPETPDADDKSLVALSRENTEVQHIPIEEKEIAWIIDISSRTDPVEDVSPTQIKQLLQIYAKLLMWNRHILRAQKYGESFVLKDEVVNWKMYCFHDPHKTWDGDIGFAVQEITDHIMCSHQTTHSASKIQFRTQTIDCDLPFCPFPEILKDNFNIRQAIEDIHYTLHNSPHATKCAVCPVDNWSVDFEGHPFFDLIPNTEEVKDADTADGLSEEVEQYREDYDVEISDLSDGNESSNASEWNLGPDYGED